MDQSSTILDYNGTDTAGAAVVVFEAGANFCGIENLTISAKHGNSLASNGVGLQLNDIDQFCGRNFTVDCADLSGNGGRIFDGVFLGPSATGYYVLLENFRINWAANSAIRGVVSGNATTIDWHFVHGNVGCIWSGGHSTYGINITGVNNTGSGVGGAIQCVDVNVLGAGTGFFVKNTNSPTGTFGSIGATLIGCGSDSCSVVDYDFINVGPNSSGVSLIGCWAGGCSGNPTLVEGHGIRFQGVQSGNIIGCRGQCLNGGLLCVIDSPTGYHSDNIVVANCNIQWANSGGAASWQGGIPPSGILMQCAGTWSVTGCVINNDAQVCAGHLSYGLWVSGDNGDGTVAGNSFNCSSGPVFVSAFTSGGQTRISGNQGNPGGRFNNYTVADLFAQLAPTKCGGSHGLIVSDTLAGIGFITNLSGTGGNSSSSPAFCESTSWFSG
jgi:hypothetical protein